MQSKNLRAGRHPARGKCHCRQGEIRMLSLRSPYSHMLQSVTRACPLQKGPEPQIKKTDLSPGPLIRMI